MVLQETAHFLDEIGLFLSCSFSTNRKEEIEPEIVTINVGHHLHNSAMTRPITGHDNKADRVANKMWKERAYNRRHIATIDPIWHPDIKNEECNGTR
jgi:hypothetical protein